MTPAREDNNLLMVIVLSLATSVALAFAYLDQIEFFYGRLSRDQMFGRDFVSFWVASKLLLADRISEIYDTEVFHRALPELTGQPIKLNPFPYPPHGLLFFLPLGVLPYGWSFAAWMVGLWGLYAWVVSRGGADAMRAVILLIAPSTVLTVTMGQNGFLTAVLFIGGFTLLNRAPLWAGILFGLLTFKPQLGLLIPLALLAGRHWGAFATAVVTTLVLVGISVLLFGLETWILYLSQTAPYQHLVMEDGEGALTQMVPSVFMAARLLDLGLSVGYALQAIFLATAAAGVVWAYRRGGDAELLAAIVLVGTFLASPYIFNYDMTLLSVAVIYLAERGLRQGFLPGERWVLGLAWLLPIVIMYLHAIVPLAPVLLAALFGITLLHVRRVPRQPATTRQAPRSF